MVFPWFGDLKSFQGPDFAFAREWLIQNGFKLIFEGDVEVSKWPTHYSKVLWILGAFNHRPSKQLASFKRKWKWKCCFKIVTIDEDWIEPQETIEEPTLFTWNLVQFWFCLLNYHLLLKGGSFWVTQITAKSFVEKITPIWFLIQCQ